MANVSAPLDGGGQPSDGGPDVNTPDAKILDAGGATPPPYDGLYTDDDKWTCRPGMADNPCTAELTVTDFLPDGSTAESPLPGTPADAAADCFYAYPTLDPGLLSPPRNLDFPQIDRAVVTGITTAQAMPFRSICRMYAPVYRQASLNAFEAEAQVREERLEFAYRDLADAFAYLLSDTAPGRPLILVAHSQGSRHLVRLIQRRIAPDPALRDRIVVAILAGPLGGLVVPKGERVGGSLDDMPLCASEAETGCVLTHNSFYAGRPPNSDYANIGYPVATGNDLGCNPGFYTGEAVPLAGAMFRVADAGPPPLGMLDFRGGTPSTDYARYAGLYTARCRTAVNGLTYLDIAVEPGQGDQRENPVLWDSLALANPSVGLHALDYAFVMTELVEAAHAKLERKLAQ